MFFSVNSQTRRSLILARLTAQLIGLALVGLVFLGALHPALDALPAPAPVFDRTQARAHQIADRLVGLVGHMDKGEFARAVEPRQRQGVAPVGLDPVAALLGYQRGRDQFADNLLPAQMPRQPEPGRPGLVDVAHLRPARGELLVETVHRVRMGRDGAVGQHVTPLRGEGDGDGLGVDIQADIFDTLSCG